MKNDCKIVMDLLEGYIRGKLNPETNNFVVEHIDSCQSCKLAYQQRIENNLKNRTDNNEDKIEIDHLKKYRKHMTILKLLLFCIIGVIIVLIVAFIIKYNYNVKIMNMTINNMETYKNKDNYSIKITEKRINYESKDEFTSIIKYSYKDGRYKRENHSESPNIVIKNADNFEYGEINSNNRTVIIEDSKIAYNTITNYNILKKDKFFYDMLNEIDEFNLNYGFFPNVIIKAGYELRTDRYNGKDCYVFRSGNKSSYVERWIEKDKMQLIRVIRDVNNKYYSEKLYSVDFGNVTDKEVTIPELQNYTFRDANNSSN